MRIIIDRFEEETAVVQTCDGAVYDIPRRLIPEGAEEGSVLSVTIDSAAEESRRAAVEKRMGDLFAD